MLQLSESFNTDTRFRMIFRRWVALDPDTGAHLSVSHGRSKNGNAPKYYLILPNKTVQERGGLFESYDWDYPTGRKIFRAWSETEAVTIGNEKLAKMLKSTRSALQETH